MNVLGLVIIDAADAEMLRILATAFEEAQRTGASTDKPEGSRYIIITDTLARQITATLRRIASGNSS